MRKKSNVSDGNVEDNDSSCPLADGQCSAAPLATITTENDEFLPSNENSLSSSKKLASALWSKQNYSEGLNKIS